MRILLNQSEEEKVSMLNVTSNNYIHGGLNDNTVVFNRLLVEHFGDCFHVAQTPLTMVHYLNGDNLIQQIVLECDRNVHIDNFIDPINGLSEEHTIHNSIVEMGQKLRALRDEGCTIFLYCVTVESIVDMYTPIAFALDGRQSVRVTVRFGLINSEGEYVRDLSNNPRVRIKLNKLPKLKLY